MLQKIVGRMVVVLVVSALATASDAGRIKEFDEYRCRLALPGPDFKWLDHTDIPQAQAAFGDDSGVMLMLLVSKVPPGFVLDDSFVKGFDESFNQPGVVNKIDGEITAFQDVPCYQIHARMEGNGLFVTGKSFAANDHMYILQLISAELPLKDRNNLEEVFSAFEFVGTPRVPQPRPAHQQQSYNSGRLIGHILGYCVIGAVILSVAKRLMRRRTSPLPSHERESSAQP